MLKTLKQFKDDIVTGTDIELISIRRENENGQYYNVPLGHTQTGVRYVSYVDTTGFYLKQTDQKNLKGSFCPWPKASNLTYKDDIFTIFYGTPNGTGSTRMNYQIKNYK